MRTPPLGVPPAHVFGAAASLMLATVACAPPAPTTNRPSAHAPRAIVVSFDAFNERRVVETVAPARIPAIRALFTEGRCAASAQPGFPSVTAAGHAALWTGAYGDVNGIPANSHLRLPASRHTILETSNGFRSGGLRAEPIWITAATAGLRTFGHHVTQAPQPPGYPTDDGEPADRFAEDAQRAERALASPRLSVVNGYNRTILAPTVVTRVQLQRAPVEAWRGREVRGAGDDLAFSLPLADDPLVRGRALHLLLRLFAAGDSAQLFASFDRDLAGAVRVVPHAEERTPPRGRALARYFSAPVVLRLDGGMRVSMRLRLFALSARDTSFTLFVPGMQLPDANRPALGAAYDSATGGWVGNSALTLWETRGLGPTLPEGGDGTAELRWLESAELMTRSFMEGAAWGWRTLAPDVMLDYFPLGDDTDHGLWGYLDRARPGYDAQLAERLGAVRDGLWELVDLRLAALMQLARADGRTRLFVAGDHGMRGVWRTFHPNAVLREAGLLALDATGAIDLARTRAASPNGYWISVNRVGRRGGIVAAADVDSVVAAVRSALLAVRDEWGAPVVTEVIDRRDPRAATLGIGGPAGGDVYYEVARGFDWSWSPDRPVVEPRRHPVGAHGFPSSSPDMHTVSCAWGAGIVAGRTPTVRLVDIAPDVQRWLGIAR